MCMYMYVLLCESVCVLYTKFSPVVVPDIHLSGLDSSKESQAALLSALGLSASRPTPPTFNSTQSNPISSVDTHVLENDVPSAVSSDNIKLCESVVGEVTKLKSIKECCTASNRVLGAMECLIARKVLFKLVASFSTVLKDDQRLQLMQFLETINLNDIKKLINLLRLVQAGRIDRIPGKDLSVTIPGYSSPVSVMECLGTAVSLLASSEKQGGAQLMQVGN